MRREETQILTYLKASPASFYSAAEISKRAGDREQFEENRRWANPHLARLSEKGLIADLTGHYRDLKDSN